MLTMRGVQHLLRCVQLCVSVHVEKLEATSFGLADGRPASNSNALMLQQLAVLARDATQNLGFLPDVMHFGSVGRRGGAGSPSLAARSHLRGMAPSMQWDR
jgi:hypothetical protein